MEASYDSLSGLEWLAGVVVRADENSRSNISQESKVHVLENIRDDSPIQNEVIQEDDRNLKVMIENTEVLPKKKKMLKGVFRCGNKFKAQIQINGVQHYLGIYNTEEEAGIAYDTQAKLSLGFKAKTNFSNHREYPLPVHAKGTFVPLPPLPTYVTEAQSHAHHTTRKLETKNRPLYNSEELNSKDVQANKKKRIYYGMKKSKSAPGDWRDSQIPSSSKPSSFEITANHSLYINSSNLTSVFQYPFQAEAKSDLPGYYLEHANQLGSEDRAYNISVSQTHLPHNINGEIPSLSDKMNASQPADRSTYNEYYSREYYASEEIQQSKSDLPSSTEPDWRDQIYYWTGYLSYDDVLSSLTWKGRWLGSFTGKPSKEEFAESNNEFLYVSQPMNKKKILSKDGKLSPKLCFLTGYYMMDNDGSGEMERYQDKELTIHFFESTHLDGLCYIVYGKGDSDFGAFILDGIYDPMTGYMELNRQYIADNDFRKDMSLSQITLYFQQKSNVNSFI